MSQLESYLQTYRETFERHASLGDREAHHRAREAARRAKFRLSPEEEESVEAALDAEYPGRRERSGLGAPVDPYWKPLPLPERPERTQRPEPTILNKHCRVYLRVFRKCRRQHHSPHDCHRRADKEADAQFHLTADERRKRDEEWLNVRLEFKGWDKPRAAEDKGSSLFDDVLHAE